MPLDLDKIREELEAARELLQFGIVNASLRAYVRDIPALLAEIDRLRERVAELEARQEVTRG